MYFCYVLYSKSIGITYTGFTSDINKRLLSHKKTPTRTTSRATDWELVWCGAFSTKELAENFERYLKSGSGRAFMGKHLISDGVLKKLKPR